MAVFFHSFGWFWTDVMTPWVKPSNCESVE